MKTSPVGRVFQTATDAGRLATPIPTDSFHRRTQELLETELPWIKYVGIVSSNSTFSLTFEVISDQNGVPSTSAAGADSFRPPPGLERALTDLEMATCHSETKHVLF